MTQESSVFDAQSIRKALKTKVLGQKIQFLPLTDSTQVAAVTLAGENAPEGMLVVADQQLAGRGRHDHTWESPAGVNLYFSLLFRPKAWPLSRGNEIQFLAAVAVAELLSDHCGVNMELKWPNDLWTAGPQGKKIGGMILSTTTRSNSMIDYVILGLGLNVNAEEQHFSPAVRTLATSIKLETGKTFDRAQLLGRLLAEMENLYADVQQHGFESVHGAWMDLAPSMSGQELRVTAAMTLPGAQHFDELRGIGRGIDAQGHLLMQTADGRQMVIADGKLEK